MRERSAWSSKGMIHPVDPIPGIENLLAELDKCRVALQHNAPYEATILKIAAARLTQFPREDDVSAAALFLTSSAVARRDAVEKIGWAEVPEQKETREAMMRAGTLLHEYVRLVMRKSHRKDEGCGVEDVLKAMANLERS